MAESMTGRIQVVSTIADIRETVRAVRTEDKTIGLVPTMGALHAGHLSLVEASLHECDTTMVTIFVNPAQFAPTEDMKKYPRTLAEDVDALADLGVEWVFAPSQEEIYPDGFSTYVEPPAAAQSLEGRCRPRHFRGVTTIVMKLFQLIPAP